MQSSFTNKICIACNKRPARIKFIKIIDGKWQECLICKACAVKFAKQDASGIDLKLDYILNGLMDQSLDEKHPTPGSVSGIGSASGIIQPTSLASLTAEDIECDHCGLSYVNYRNTLILGCTHCYESFKDRLMNDLHRMHGAIKHTGRHPTPPSRAKAGMDSDFVLPKDPVMMVSSSEAGGLVPKVPSIAELKDSLQNAIDREEFELAAKLRDEIRRLEIDLKETDAS